jgi:TolB-like protein/DNA-binding winged helix-turn-helix (wHTH) protein/tetratricopeptide (TPR) repeat protein
MNERFARAGVIARVDLAHEPDFALGRVGIQPSRREIIVEGRHETVEPRVMRVLVALARARGGIVSREDLIESCWDGVIVGEDAIRRCISQLRKAAEASGNAFSIETVSRVGYRLTVMEGRPAASQAEDAAIEEAPPTVAPPEGAARSAAAPRVPVQRLKWIAPFSAVALLVLLVAGLAAWRFGPLTRALPANASVAVLPFVNMSADPRQEYFSDGFSEELVNDLANDPHLQVASRTSSFAFKGKNENVETIARALGVGSIVEGSVREAGNRVRITAQLINAGNGYHLWSATYDRNLTDIISVQDELARAVAAQLTHRLMPAPATPLPTIDPDAYRLFLEGMHQFDLGPPRGWQSALATFKQVTERAPGFAEGFAWLSRVAQDLADVYDPAPASDWSAASDAAERALSLDSHNAMARAVRAVAKMTAWDWPGAAADLRVLRRQNPNSHFTINGLYDYYRALGFPDEALAVWQRLHVLDPQTYNSAWLTLSVLDDTGRFQEEIGVARMQLVHYPRDTSRLNYLCEAYTATGQVAKARAIGERLVGMQADAISQTDSQSCELYIAIATGDRPRALAVLALWESEFPDKFPHAGTIAANCVLLGDFASASTWFDRAYERREGAFFTWFYSRGFGAEKRFEQYRLTTAYRALQQKPLFKAWQAEHDRIAAALAAHRDPLSSP